MIGPAKIVVRYASGKTLKGYSQDFSPASPHFHVRPNEAAGSGSLLLGSSLVIIHFEFDLQEAPLVGV